MKAKRGKAKRGKPIVLDEFHYHEAIHTAFVLMETFGNHVVEHPAVEQDPKLVAKGEHIVEKMYELYNELMLQRLDKFPDKDDANENN